MAELDDGRNAPSLDTIVLMPPGEVAGLSASVLKMLSEEAEARVEAAKALKDYVGLGISLRFKDRIAEARRETAKDTGTVRIVDDGVPVIADVAKRVDWDQARVAEIVNRIRAAGDDPAEYVETTYKVQERKFNAWPANIRAAFEAARTVKPGPQKISFGAEA